MDVVEASEPRSGTARFTFTFTDNGIGMKPEFVEQIFDVFTREKDSRVDKTEGSGLGMAITIRIVEMLGGTIDVKSRPGKGSMFVICLPLTIDDSKTFDLDLPDVSILVADDDENACEYAVHALKECGADAGVRF